MTDEELDIYDQIIGGGYGTIKTEKIMIVGDIEMLKNILLVSHNIQSEPNE